MANPVTEGIREARAVRARAGVPPLQTIDPGAVATILGIVVVRRPLRSAVLSGIHLYDGAADSHFILVNSAQRVARQRFTLAHEIGHARFDHATIVESLPAPPANPEEKRANAFAAELLMPESAIAQWKPDRPWGESPNDIARLAIHFGLSFDATLWRLYNSRHLEDAEQMKSRRNEVSADLRSALRQPGDGRIEFPEHFVAMVEEGLARGLVSHGRAAELIDPEDEF